MNARVGTCCNDPLSAMYRPALLLALLASLLLTSCGMLEGSSRDSHYHRRFFPTIQYIHHPDTVRVDDDARLSDVRRAWSVSHLQRTGSGNFSPHGYTTSATLMSRELVEMSLDYGVGTADLSADLRDQMRDQEMEAYRDFVWFTVYMFVPNRRPYTLGDVNLGGAGSRVELVIDETRYRPDRIVGSDLMRELTIDGSEVFQRGNQVAFPRYVEGDDILEGAEEIRLIVSPSGVRGDELWFSWRIRDTDA